MESKPLARLLVVGAGMMGNQIAELIARVGGYPVTMVDSIPGVPEKARAAIADRMERFFVAKGKMTAAEKQAVLDRIGTAENIAAAARDADFAIEAAVESLPVKQDIFRALDASAPPRAILASNTSFQHISEIAAATRRPEKVVGMHFFNPVALMRLVEIVKTAKTSTETIATVSALAVKLGKEPVVCRDISYGFLANRAYVAMQQEAVAMLAEKVAPPEDIDRALVLGYNLPIGPLQLGDAVGAWSIWASSEADAIRTLGPGKGSLHPLLKAMLGAGYVKIYDYWRDVLAKEA
ncbi:MAG: 3-hydroxyacyl-CoA dehydrogenase family protein [Chloroflexota bacterium]